MACSRSFCRYWHFCLEHQMSMTSCDLSSRLSGSPWSSIGRDGIASKAGMAFLIRSRVSCNIGAVVGKCGHIRHVEQSGSMHSSVLVSRDC